MKKLYIFMAVAVMFLGLNCALFGVLAGDGAPLVIGSIPDSEETVAAFFDAMQTGDYEKAMEYVGNYDSFGFEKEGSELIELYKETISECYEIKFVDTAGEKPASRLQDVQRVELTFLDCRLLLAAVSENTTEAAMDYMNDGNVIENDEQAMSFVYDALRECLSTPELYCSTESFDIALNYDGKSWKMEINDELADALFGCIENLSTEGIN